jgi:protein-S-isoprenylcysteine O-methyltransferase Ste14
MTTATWIAMALLTPFWWGLGLFILAWFGDVSPPLRARVSRLFEGQTLLAPKRVWLQVQRGARTWERLLRTIPSDLNDMTASMRAGTCSARSALRRRASWA